MSQRTFQFRLRSSHSALATNTQSLVVEWLSDSGVWEPQVPTLTTPGFRLYLLSLLLCQHHYLVANATEHDQIEVVAHGIGAEVRRRDGG